VLGDHAAHRALTPALYTTLKEQVMNLTIPPDTRVNIDKLAREQQVSNTPLREALTRLEAEELVTRRNLRGYWTAGLLDQRGARSPYAARRLLEPSAAEVAAQGEDTAPLTAPLEETLDDMAQSARLPTLDHDYHRYRDFVEADARFHNAIAVASGNSLLANILAGRNAHAHNYRLCFHGGMADATLNEHRAVQDALIARDPAAAATTMRIHSENARDRLLPVAAPPAGDELADD